ncbi:hypothetical protein [Streptomyces cupreus]|uniref:Uncharacterized protein n=1 Tax=Streptomyces cupreus TaxID=2759956 RepID=A0A7X1J2Z3_9ACTN|nr:hypothetical protein [Streptomyces cupreus]MBC2903166.1 hypothetical protein [Streptomyces cupreus]
MKNPPTPGSQDTPRIVQGARLLAALSVIWSGYAITDLMHSGPWGLTVAIAGDIGWITVLWAEANRVRIAGRTWPAAAAGWLIATGVGGLLAVHGAQGPDGSWAKAMAGVLVITVSKVVWLFALAATVDPSALTPEQEQEINSVRREAEFIARLQRARSDGEIARIEEEARAVLARDEADFQIVLERIRKRAEIDRRTPLAFTASTSATEQLDVFADRAPEQPNLLPNVLAARANTAGEQVAGKAVTSPNQPIGEPSMADLVREQVASTTNNRDAVNAVMAARPDANRDSVSAAVRRERRKTQGYA